MPQPRNLPKGHVSVQDPDYDNYFSIEPKTGRLFWADKEVVARKTIDITGIGRGWAWLSGSAIALGGLGAFVTGAIDLNKEICIVASRECAKTSLPPVDNGSLAAIVTATTSIATKLQTLVNQTEPPLAVDNRSLEAMATAATTIAANTTELLKKIEKPPAADIPPPPPPPESNVYFGFGSQVAGPGSAIAMNDWARFLKAHPAARIEVRGYADSNGSAEDNLRKSNERAAFVVGELVKRGVSQSQVIPKGFGAANPIADNALDIGRTMNRRVEFILLQ